jgi:hypothetical protein
MTYEAGQILPVIQTGSTVILPTPDETAEAMELIERKRSDEAAKCLQNLALAVINSVIKVDQECQVHRFLVNMEIICEGPGQFRLNITDKNSKCDPQALVQRVADSLVEQHGPGYNKQLRAIQMEFSNDNPTGPGGDGA